MNNTAEKLNTVQYPATFTDLSNDDYHGSSGISKTKLDMFARDQAGLEWAKNCPVDTDKLKTLDFGDAMHAICLEPDRLKTEFVVMPKLNLRTNAGKEEKLEFEKEHKDSCILTAEEHKKLGLMFESVMAHPYARKLIENPGVSEQSHYWIDEETGILCKCRPDRNLTDTPILMDIKTTDYLHKFKFSIDDYRYYVQDPFYLDGVNACGEEKDTFVFLVIQKSIELGRYPVRCEVLPAGVSNYGRGVYKQNLRDYETAKRNNQFNGIFTSEVPYRLTQQIQF